MGRINVAYAIFEGPSGPNVYEASGRQRSLPPCVSSRGPVAAELVCAAECFCETARLLHSLIRLFVLEDSEASLRKGQ